MGDEHESGSDPTRDDGDLRDHDHLRTPGQDAQEDPDAEERRRERAFNDQRDEVITQAEGMTQRAADEHDAQVRRAAAVVRDAEEVGRTAAHPLPDARRASDAPEPPSPNHPAAELRWLEVEQRMIARALDEAGISYEQRTIEMVAYDASDRRAVDIALRAMDALYGGGEPN